MIFLGVSGGGAAPIRFPAGKSGVYERGLGLMLKGGAGGQGQMKHYGSVAHQSWLVPITCDALGVAKTS